jgi:hypothetical protein
MLALQRAAGNQAVARLLRGGAVGVLQREVTVGGALPDLKQMQGARSFDHLPVEQRRTMLKAEVKSKSATALTAAQAAVTGGGALPTAADLKTVSDAVATALDTSDAFRDALLAVANDGGVVATAKIELLVAFLEAVDRSAMARDRFTKLDSEIDKRTGDMAKRPDVGKVPPTPKERQDFAAALRQMKGFGELVKSLKANKLKPVMVAAWKNGGSLANSITEVAETPPAVKDDTGIKDGSFEKKVRETDLFYRQILEPEIMLKIDRPEVHVHLEKAMKPTNPGGFRAFQSGKAIHVAQDHDRKILIHEVGHYVEDNLADKSWQDIQLLMRARHATAGGGVAGDTGFGEARYEGDYPATGPYTSRAYDDTGSTEVTSMTVEYLSQAGNVDALLDTDPTQVAVVVRGFRPKEYAATPGLRPFDKFLP